MPNLHPNLHPIPNHKVQFEAYLHVNAILWRVVFRELRALTNDKRMALNPLELNNLYEDLWAVGDMLLTDDSLHLLQDEYRPWGKTSMRHRGWLEVLCNT